MWDAGVNMTMVYGGTEFGSPVHIRQREDIEDREWMWLRMMEDIQVRWVPQEDDTYECQILVCTLLRSVLSILCCDICSPYNIDDREQSNGGREPSRREGICNFGFVHQASNQELVEDVRLVPYAGIPAYLVTR